MQPGCQRFPATARDGSRQTLGTSISRAPPSTRGPKKRGRERPALRSRLTGQPCAHGSRRTAGLAVAIVEGILIDQTEDVGSFVIGSHHQLAAGRERAPQWLFLVAGWIGALQATYEGVALLFGYDQGRKPAAPSFNLGNSVPLANPRADEGD